MPEIVDDGATGLLVEPGRLEALADALEALLRDPDRRRTMGAEATAWPPSASCSSRW